MAISELNHEKRSGAERVTKPDAVTKSAMRCSTNLAIWSRKWKSCLFILPEMDKISRSVGNVQQRHLSHHARATFCDSADPFKPVHTRDIVTDARVSSSIMTLSLWTALSYTARLYAEVPPFSRITKPEGPLCPYALTPCSAVDCMLASSVSLIMWHIRSGFARSTTHHTLAV